MVESEGKVSEKDIEWQPWVKARASAQVLHIANLGILFSGELILAKGQVNCHQVFVQREFYLSQKTDNVQRTQLSLHYT